MLFEYDQAEARLSGRACFSVEELQSSGSQPGERVPLKRPRRIPQPSLTVGLLLGRSRIAFGNTTAEHHHKSMSCKYAVLGQRIHDESARLLTAATALPNLPSSNRTSEAIHALPFILGG